VLDSTGSKQRYQTVIKPEVIDNSHSQLIALISDNSKVLDVGCASGVLGEYLSKEKGCDVVGWDSDEKALAIADSRGCYSRLERVDLEEISADVFHGEVFDCIVLGDVLEHVVNANAVIDKLKKCLSNDGRFLISIPNVGHGSIKLNLLCNNFRYTEEGLLDRTHLSFFTPDNILFFCRENELKVVSFGRVFASIYGMEQAVDAAVYPNDVLRFVEKDLESWVYQYVFSVQPVSGGLPAEDEVMMQASKEEKERFEHMLKRHARSKSSFGLLRLRKR
jgi:2-polyprenyl-3-methyl-5-hydroxy-6-metoxy-1,4-benzoquinol methylase